MYSALESIWILPALQVSVLHLGSRQEGDLCELLVYFDTFLYLHHRLVLWVQKGLPRKIGVQITMSKTEEQSMTILTLLQVWSRANSVKKPAKKTAKAFCMRESIRQANFGHLVELLHELNSSTKRILQRIRGHITRTRLAKRLCACNWLQEHTYAYEYSSCDQHNKQISQGYSLHNFCS